LALENTRLENTGAAVKSSTIGVSVEASIEVFSSTGAAVPAQSTP
jgi:hypothetical protein